MEETAAGLGALFWPLVIVTWALLLLVAYAIFDTKKQLRELHRVVRFIAEEQRKLNRYLALAIDPEPVDRDPSPPSLQDQLKQVRGD